MSEENTIPQVDDEATRKNQRKAFMVLGFFAVVSVACFIMSELYIYLIAYLWFGFTYGLALQYGRFCFSSAFRDLFAVGVPRMVVGIMIATVLFGLSASFVNASGESTFHPAPTSIHAMIAGLIFGIGMVFAGGCASGSLYKAGEGNGVSMIVILSISTTQAIFADVAGWTNYLVPNSWKINAAAMGQRIGTTFVEAIKPTDGWLDLYLSGYVWQQPVKTWATSLGMKDASVTGAFIGNLLVGVIIPASLILVVVYVIWSRKSYVRDLGKPKEEIGFMDHVHGYWAMIVSSKRTAIAGLILGVACGAHMFVMKGLRHKFDIQNAGAILRGIGQNFGISAKGTVFDPGYWYVTTQEAQWIGWIFNKLGWDNMDNIYFGWANGIPNPLFNPADWMSLALIGGSAVMALLFNEFKWKKPTRELAVWAIIGGALMGIGSRLGLGCNVGAFFVRTANGDMSGWIFGIGMIMGAFVGVKFFTWWTERKMAKAMESFDL